MPETKLLDVQNVSFGYESTLVLSSLNFSVNSGEIVTLVGPSGCGKSTFLRVIAGLEQSRAGQIIEYKALDRKRFQTGARLLFQDYDAFPWFTVLDNVLEGSGPQPYPSPDFARSILLAVGLEGREGSFPNELSGGMRKRLALARILVREPSLLLLDEPFASLDIGAKSSMYKLVQKLCEETKCGVILVTHDIHEALLLATRVDVASARPMKIKRSFNVPFPRPRDESILDTREYPELRKQITLTLSAESEI